MGTRPAELTETKFGNRGRVAAINMFHILSNSVKGFPGCEGENGTFLLNLTVALTTGQHYGTFGTMLL